jgi:hypothetical protein
MSLIRKISKRLSARKKIKEVHIDRLEDISEWMYWGSKSESLRFFLPAGILRMHGAFAYSGGVHPFLEAMRAGPEALSAFYGAHQPGDIAAAHWLDEPAPGVGPSELPWIGREPEYAYSGEKGLDRKHGISMYGPCTAEKVALEVSRLAGLRKVIANRGYNPDRHGDIQGVFLRSGSDYRFFVRGGKHRAAVLAALGYSHIPVAFTRDWPRVIDIADIASWSLVRQGRLSAGMANSVFKSYFLFDGTQQYKRLKLTTAV